MQKESKCVAAMFTPFLLFARKFDLLILHIILRCSVYLAGNVVYYAIRAQVQWMSYVVFVFYMVYLSFVSSVFLTT